MSCDLKTRYILLSVASCGSYSLWTELGDVGIVEQDMDRALQKVNAGSHVLHRTLSHVDKNQGIYVRLLFIDYNSAFNTIVPHKLSTKLRNWGLNSSLVVRVDSSVSNTITLNMGAPQADLSPRLYSLHTQDCAATHSFNSIIKHADDASLTTMRQHTKRRWRTWHCGVKRTAFNWMSERPKCRWCISAEDSSSPTAPSVGNAVERVSSFWAFTCLSWITHIRAQSKTARQCLYHLTV